ncbi:hypothetical protein ACWEWQ_34755, partial [Streptomyces sp. NPDC003832]
MPVDGPAARGAYGRGPQGRRVGARPRVRLGHPEAGPDLPRGQRQQVAVLLFLRRDQVATGQDALPVTYPQVLGFPLAMRLMSGWDFPLP